MSFAVALALALGATSQAMASTAPGSTNQGRSAAALLMANVYYVSLTGSDTNSGSSASPFKTFAKAVSVLMPGDTLQVQAGRYAEALILSKSGTAAAPINVIGNGAIVDVKSAKTTAIKISGSYINLSGFEVMGATDAGIGIPGKYVTVKKNIVHDNVTQNGIGTCGISTTGWSSAVKVGVGGQNITIDGNTVYNNCGEGIAITRGVSVTVQNNTSYDNWAQNIYIDNSPYTTVQNNQVYCTGARVRADGKRPSGIGLGEELYSGWGAQMHDVLVTGNTVRDCGKGIGAYASQVSGTFTNVTITKNYVPSGQLRPISLSTSPNKNVVISYNTIFTDPYISDKVGVTLTGNTIGTSAPVIVPTATATKTTVAPTATLPPATKTAVPVISPTATVAPAFTPTTIAPASPTPTTIISAPTQVQSTVDSIFASGFESGLAGWSGSSNGGGDLSVSPSAALAGSNGLQLVINDTTAMYVTDDSPNAEPRYRVRFYFDPNSISMGNGDAHILFRGMNSASAVGVRLEFGFSSGTYQIRAAIVNDSASWTSTNWVPLSDAPHAIEFDWRAATAAGANNGGLTLWVDGAQQADLTGVDNDTWRLDRVRLGALADVDAGTNGTYYFDAFDSRRQSYIGQ